MKSKWLHLFLSLIKKFYSFKFLKMCEVYVLFHAVFSAVSSDSISVSS
jgi:hypothetical protein